MALRVVHSWGRGLLFAGRAWKVERARWAMRGLSVDMAEAWWGEGGDKEEKVKAEGDTDRGFEIMLKAKTQDWICKKAAFQDDC